MKFKETELPAKEADKNRSKVIYQSLEVKWGASKGSEWGVSWFGGSGRMRVMYSLGS